MTSNVIKFFTLSINMFDDEKIKLIESMPDRDAILVIWIKLIALATKINDTGYVYLTETMPYDEEMLATALNRPVNTVRLALACFKRYEMIEVHDDGTLYLPNWHKHQHFDALERMREQTRKRVQKYRMKMALPEACNVTVTKCNAENRIEKNRIDIRERKEYFSEITRMDYDSLRWRVENDGIAKLRRSMVADALIKCGLEEGFEDFIEQYKTKVETE